MGIFSFLFGGGNIRLSAEAIYNLYRDCGFDYLKTFSIKFPILCDNLREKIRKRGYSYYEDVYGILRGNDVRCLTNFALLDLNINAAPYFTPYGETVSSFAKEVFSYLVPSVEKYNLNQSHFFGNNNDITAEFVHKYLSMNPL